ncbi:MAG: ATP-binding protein, partial [Planctomycetota bacterium]
MTNGEKTRLAKEQLQFTDEQFIWRFSPNQTAPELLEAIFVGREDLLQNVVEKIADSAATGSTQHVLLYGPRGIGKSHLTSLVHYRLTKDEELSESVHIAWLNEDETTTSMVQLLVRLYRSLCKWYPNEYSAEWLDEVLDQPPEEITGVLTRRLVERFSNRRLVILVENLNILFENLGKDGQHELRALLEEHPFANLIATSQQLFKAVTQRSEPFFGFFQQIQLAPLSLEDAQQLLLKIAATKEQADLVQFLSTADGRGRVRAIHDLAGGNHRVYIVLSGFITRESLDHLVAPFQKMA